MTMKESILRFAEEFSWEPIIENRDKLAPIDIDAPGASIIVAGMGGSPLAADLLIALDPTLNIIVHKDYGLPPIDAPGASILVAISYSGNTEETIDAFETAKKEGLSVAVIAKGGALLDRARQEAAPFVQLPDSDIQPRMASGFIIKALAALLGLDALQRELTALAPLLKPAQIEESGRALAARIGDRAPLIYASARNRAIAYNWKIKLNETGKIHAFFNVFPELNHNEMNGFSSRYYTVILRDPDDHPRIKKRMEALDVLYKKQNVFVEIIDEKGATHLHRIFDSLVLADWTALAIAEARGVDPAQVPMVEEFKRCLSN